MFRAAAILTAPFFLLACSTTTRIEVRNHAPWDAAVRFNLIETGQGQLDSELVVLAPHAAAVREHDLSNGRWLQVHVERLARPSAVFVEHFSRGVRRTLIIEDDDGELLVRRKGWW